MDRNYPGNANSQKNTKKLSPPKKVEKVTTGSAKLKRKSMGERLSETFFAAGFQEALRTIIFDVLIPDTKGTISEMLKGIVDTMLFGERRGSRGRGGKPANYGYTSYQNFYQGGSQAQNAPPPPQKPSVKPVVDDLVFDTREEAEEVLQAMRGILHEYGAVSVRNLYELSDITTDYTKERYGWYNLEGSCVQRVSEGYLLDLPRPVVID